MLTPRIFLSAALLALAGPTRAQTPAPADTARYYKHHLGLTASPVLEHFFIANRSLPVGLLYKREAKPGRLLRLGIQLTQNLNNRLDGTTAPFPAYVNDNFVLGVAATIGREYARPLSRRLTATAGADLVVGYGYARFHVEGPTNAFNGEVARKVHTNVDKTYQLALAPFVGVRYSLHRRIYVAAEATVSVAYRRISYKTEGSTTGLTTGNQTDVLDNNTRYNLVNVAFRPVSQLTLHYMLGQQ